MRVFVSGGAGYIGSHTVVHLVAVGHDVGVVDSFATAQPAVMGRLDALTSVYIPVHAFDLTDKDKTEHLFVSEPIDAVIREDTPVLPDGRQAHGNGDLVAAAAALLFNAARWSIGLHDDGDGEAEDQRERDY